MRRKLTAILITMLILAALCGLTAQAQSLQSYDAANPQLLSAQMIGAQSAILIDADSGDVLFEKDANIRMNPASTTKIMTLMLAIESGIPLDREVAIPQAAADIPSDSSLIPVYPGETISFGDLLLGFEINSGNDGGNAIAVLVSGTIDNFVALMNARAADLGCTGTRFANPHGYTNEYHYSTAHDLALIAREAMRSETFRKIVSTTSAKINVRERGEILLRSDYQVMREDSKYYYDECIGIKSGSTSAAGKCFVGAAEKDGATLISVVLKCADDDAKWTDTVRLFDYGWSCYDSYTLDRMYAVARSQIASFVISNASEDDINDGVLDLDIAQISDSSYLRMVERESPSALADAAADFIAHSTVQVTHDLTAPISMGEIVGDFSYYDAASGNTVTAKLVASREVAQRVARATLTDYFPFLKVLSNPLFVVLLIVLAVLILLIILLALSRRAARQRRRRRIYEQRRQEYLKRRQPQARGATVVRRDDGRGRRGK